jgi:hypothetical protein
MTPDNFNWFLHVILFYHTQRIIQKQGDEGQEMEEEEEDEEEEEEDGDDDL